MDDALVVLTFVTALGCSLSAGALFAFSSFVMPALARLPSAQGIAAMQSINLLAPTPVFMTALFGSALASVVVAVWGLAAWDGSSSPWLLAGAALYIAGTAGLTMAFHVPRNNALAALDPEDAGSEAYWRRYLTEWTRGNHVRVAAGVAATAAFIAALIT
jgi:uncharacterized membrane protein